MDQGPEGIKQLSVLSLRTVVGLSQLPRTLVKSTSLESLEQRLDSFLIAAELTKWLDLMAYKPPWFRAANWHCSKAASESLHSISEKILITTEHGFHAPLFL